MDTVYKRSIFKMLYGIIGAPVAGAIVGAIFTLFVKPVIAIGIAVVICLLILYMTLFSDNVSFAISGTKFICYKGKKIIAEYELKGAEIGYKIKQSNTADVVDLYINGDTIDCAPIGRFRFNKMLSEIESIAGPKVQKVKVGGTDGH